MSLTPLESHPYTFERPSPSFSHPCARTQGEGSLEIRTRSIVTSLLHCLVTSHFGSNNFLIHRSALPKHARPILYLVNDAIFTVATIVFFAAAILYLRACERFK